MATTHREGSVFHHDGDKVTHYETGAAPAAEPAAAQAVTAAEPAVTEVVAEPVHAAAPAPKAKKARKK